MANLGLSKILFLVSLLFVALLNSILTFKFLIFYHSYNIYVRVHATETELNAETIIDNMAVDICMPLGFGYTYQANPLIANMFTSYIILHN